MPFFFPPAVPCGKLISAMRCPSVATISIFVDCTFSSAPLSWKRVSSCVMAKITFATIVFSSSRGIVYVSCAVTVGSVG